MYVPGSERLNAEVEQRSENGHSAGVLPNYQDYVLADTYFQPFDLACRSTSPKIVAIALDCIQVGVHVAAWLPVRHVPVFRS